MKYIALLDCNNFFVSCERLFRPDLAKKPVAVLSSNDGCIVARSQEVKDMGIPMGLPLFQAKQLCDTSKITFFSSNFTLYRDISARVMRILAEEVGKCDVYSIDEAFFAIDAPAEAEVAALRQRIIQKSGIPVSIGVAATKTLAKEASKIGKKSTGVCLLTSDLWVERASKTPCGDIWNLGRATTAKLTKLGVTTASDFMNLERSFVRSTFGVAGERIYDELHGTAVHVLDMGPDEASQSVTSSRSFAGTTNELSELQSAVAYHVTQVAAKTRAAGLLATLMYIELRASRHGDFAYHRGGVEVHLDGPTNSTQKLTELALTAVASVFDAQVPYKKAGVTLSGLIPEVFVSQSLFSKEETSGQNAVDAVLDSINAQYGFAALHNAAILPSLDRSSVKLRSKSYTAAWKDIPTVRA